jgi:hypothetical protein
LNDTKISGVTIEKDISVIAHKYKTSRKRIKIAKQCLYSMLATLSNSSSCDGECGFVLFYLLLPFLGIFLLMQEIYD